MTAFGEGSQFDARQFDAKMNELPVADGEEFFTSYDEVYESFDAMGLQENLLRGIYAYAFEKPSAIQQRPELNEIGIPFGDDHKGCKIVLTSRSDDVCNHMGTHKKITVQVLPEEESWNLFKEMAGICNDTSHITDLHSTQKVVAKECGGLPIAIVTVGRSLNGREKPLWDYAFTQLQKSIGKNIKGVDGKVFSIFGVELQLLRK
ncbi:hypothetical protein LOK49_LG12G02645 [Camellia lanceoleosa]|uniref:Uncharacterized protein n=1 Tax=Camellia lanceoleosa TaxID=1840588 RepID=A0ACC0FXS5_9ERIC|nr:hypothetical protein LOK49_LG12G02645 [Camellia lanceoleosa]